MLPKSPEVAINELKRSIIEFDSNIGNAIAEGNVAKLYKLYDQIMEQQKEIQSNRKNYETALKNLHPDIPLALYENALKQNEEIIQQALAPYRPKLG